MIFKAGCVLAFCLVFFASDTEAGGNEIYFGYIEVLYPKGEGAKGGCVFCGTVKIKSLLFKRNYLIGGASEVKYIKLLKENSHNRCHVQAYGIKGPSVYVSGGCDGFFEVCYRKGTLKTARCANNHGHVRACAANCDNIKALGIKYYYKRPCVARHDYFYVYGWIKVTNFCDAEFYVVCDDVCH